MQEVVLKDGKNYIKLDTSLKRRQIIYKTTEKPSGYVHVDIPKDGLIEDSPMGRQIERQIHMDNWYKAIGIYDGPFMPEDPNKLQKQGWREDTRSKATDRQVFVNDKKEQ